MTEPRQMKPSLADAVVVAAGDPIGWFCVLVVGGSWKVGLIVFAFVAVVMLIAGVVILGMRRWDI
ncbi:hypothetical protein ACQR0Z_10280 [Bradyrhizobium sp. HKCCYLS3077]|uniref:hypothetical protein n=1 Tax=Bradyrhizobium sp. HKCCYLS3077 TaxID=3420761 RepID=UPI003EB78A22